MQYQAQDDQGNWHNVDGFQAAALRLDGVAVRTVTNNDLSIVYKCDELGKVKSDTPNAKVIRCGY